MSNYWRKGPQLCRNFIVNILPDISPERKSGTCHNLITLFEDMNCPLEKLKDECLGIDSTFDTVWDERLTSKKEDKLKRKKQ